MRMQAANLRGELIGCAMVVDHIISAGKALRAGGLSLDDGLGLGEINGVARHQSAQLLGFVKINEQNPLHNVVVILAIDQERDNDNGIGCGEFAQFILDTGANAWVHDGVECRARLRVAEDALA
jgi:hypothetical protein